MLRTQASCGTKSTVHEMSLAHTENLTGYATLRNKCTAHTTLSQLHTCYTKSHYTTLQYTTLNCTLLQPTKLHSLYYSVQHYTALYCISLQYTTLYILRTIRYIVACAPLHISSHLSYHTVHIRLESCTAYTTSPRFTAYTTYTT